MTQTIALPEIQAASGLVVAMAEACASCGGVRGLEANARNADFGGFGLLGASVWRELCDQVRAVYRREEYVVVRGLPVTEDGGSLILAALATGRRLRTYRGNQIVKKFEMSPWTTDLSHTIREGDFHTDLNTDPEPPALTAIQCLRADPGAPDYGQNRVARLEDILAHLRAEGRADVGRFLEQAEVTMSSSSTQSWTGSIIRDSHVRYHPATLRAAQQLPEVATILEEMIQAVHIAALSVSLPFDLGPGDLLFVSNRRALHYRGECSVRFKRFPTEYDSRAIFVLHQLAEAQ